jgi:hypothetical protein
METTIATIQSEYYDSIGGKTKNPFQKNMQKFACAATICHQIPVTKLLEETIYRSDAYNLYFRYSQFKTFAHPTVYWDIVHRIISVTQEMMPSMCITVHVDLQGFTASAAQRYACLIPMLNTICAKQNTQFTAAIQTIYLYNVPKSMDAIRLILTPFLAKEILSRLVVIDQ